MPYPNEHAARIRNPDLFEPDSFRSKDLKDGIRLILGKLKGGNGSMIVQAYRFSVDKFTVEEVKKWLKDNKIKYISFEKATPMESIENKIAHAGIKGMKWRERKEKDIDPKAAAKIRERLASQKNKKNDGESEIDYKTAAKLREKKIDQMSDEDFNKLTKNVDLHEKYKNINKAKVDNGKKKTERVISAVAQVSGSAAHIAALAALARIGTAAYRRMLDRFSSL